MPPPAWRQDCPTCVRLAEALDSAGARPAPANTEPFRAHLVDEHLAQLPGYADGCTNCGEWRAMQGDPAGSLSSQYGGRVVPILGREDLLHRAGHLMI